MKALSKWNGFVGAAALLVGLTVLNTACEEETEIIEKEVIKEVEVRDTVTLDPLRDYKTPKYVFYFIGDGMSNAQINLAEAALGDGQFQLKSTNVELGELNIRKFPVSGMQTTHAEDRYITGSAASATALATGYKTTIGTISMNGDDTENLKTMAEIAKEKGMKVGVVSSVSIDHATPACFYAHASTRGHYNYIAAQMDDSGFDYFGGGYAKGNFEKYKDNSTPGKRVPEGFTPVDIEADMIAAGYTIAKNKTELNAVGKGTKCWAFSDQYDGSAALPYDVERADSDISLADFTKRGIELMDNENGFFMMVEGGKIDWACHANDAVATTYDMIAFDQAIGEALAFYDEHPDETLIVVTGDHECGGLSLGFANTGYSTAFELLQHQTCSYDEFTSMWYEKAEKGEIQSFQDVLTLAKTNFGLGNAELHADLALSAYELNLLEEAFNRSYGEKGTRPSEEAVTLFGGYDPFTVTVTHILNHKAGIDWATYSHTGSPIPVFAKGPGELNFSGYYDNTDVAKKIMEIADLK